MVTTNRAKAIAIFSQLSNINFGYSATSPEALVDNFNRVKTIIPKEGKNFVSDKLQELWDCNWQVVWVPALNISPNEDNTIFYADNSMYVVKGRDTITKTNVYVVAIAGTNSLSEFEKNKEDADVFKKPVAWMDTFKPIPEQHGNIARGSNTGLEKVWGHFEYGPANTLLDFFESQDKTDMEIITCGHSLGGALSPLVALKLKEWSNANSHGIKVSTYPTAGPTTGDDTFAAYIVPPKEVKPKYDTLQNNYHSLINTIDIVPMAWESKSLIKMAHVYDKFGIKPNKCETSQTDSNKTSSACLESKMLKAAAATARFHYTRIGKDVEQIFEGSPNPTPKPSDDPFLTEAMYQHSISYLRKGFEFDQKFTDDLVALLYPDRNSHQADSAGLQTAAFDYVLGLPPHDLDV